MTSYHLLSEVLSSPSLSELRTVELKPLIQLSQPPAKESKSNLSAQLLIPRIVCQSCVSKLRSGLAKLPAELECSDTSTKLCNVRYDSNLTTLEKIISRITLLGFGEDLEVRRLDSSMDEERVIIKDDQKSGHSSGFSNTPRLSQTGFNVLGSPDTLTKTKSSSSKMQADLSIGGMTCSSCSSSIERLVRSLNGVDSCDVSLVTQSAVIVFNAAIIELSVITEEIEDIGFDVLNVNSVISRDIHSTGGARNNSAVNSTRMMRHSLALARSILEQSGRGFDTSDDSGIMKSSMNNDSDGQIADESERVTRNFLVRLDCEFHFIDLALQKEIENINDYPHLDLTHRIRETLARLPGIVESKVTSNPTNHSEGLASVIFNRFHILPAAIMDELRKEAGVALSSASLRRVFPEMAPLPPSVIEKHSKINDELPDRSNDQLSNVILLIEELDEEGVIARTIESECLQRWPRLLHHFDFDFLTKRTVIWYYSSGGDYCCESASMLDVYSFIRKEFAANGDENEVTILDSVREERDEFRATQLRELQKMRLKLVISAVFAIPALMISMVLPYVSESIRVSLMKTVILPGRPSLTLMGVLLICLATPVQFYVGKSFYHSAWMAWTKGNRSTNMSTLIVIGTTTAWIYGFLTVLFALMFRHSSLNDSMVGGEHFFETSSTVITVVLLGKYLQLQAKFKTTDAISMLLTMQASEAHLVRVDDCGRIVTDGGDLAGAQLTGVDNDDESGDRVSTELLMTGDIIKVLRGERVPLDGTVVYGSTWMDESSLTGESVPRSVGVSDSVLTSAINCGESVIFVRIDKSKDESVLCKIVKLMRDSQMKKPSQQEIADRLSSYFVPFVMSIALLTFLIWFSLSITGIVPREWRKNHSYGHESEKYTYQNPLIFSLLFSMSVIVISCPCALGLATPTAIMVGIGVGSKFGLLIKGGNVLELAYKLNTIVFDKTGTLTLGIPTVIEFVNLAKDSFSENQLISLAGSAELNSEHPLAKAIVEHARSRPSDDQSGDDPSDLALTAPLSFEAVPGKGITAMCGDRRIHIGNYLWFFGEDEKKPDEKDIDPSSMMRNPIAKCLRISLDSMESSSFSSETQAMSVEQIRSMIDERSELGKIPLLMAVDYRLTAVIVLFDPPRAEAKAVINELMNTRDIDTQMLTGDAERTAVAIANQLGLDQKSVISQVLPQHKHSVIGCLQKRMTDPSLIRQRMIDNENGIDDESHGLIIPDSKMLTEDSLIVAMVGDGVNDAAAMSEADLGIAIGNGTDIAIEAADVILMRDNLESILILLDLSATVIRRIYWNFGWAIGFNVLGIPIAAGLLFPLFRFRLPPEFAAIAMGCSSLTVLCSSLLLKLYSPPRSLILARSSHSDCSDDCRCPPTCPCVQRRRNKGQSVDSTTTLCLCVDCACSKSATNLSKSELKVFTD